MNNNFIGVIIEESLEDKGILEKIKIIKTKVEAVIDDHETPWLKQWTLHTIEVPEKMADSIAEDMSKSLESKHDWYADFKNDEVDYIIFKNKIFKINRANIEEYNEATRYGLSLGIPNHQVDFSPRVKSWKR